MIEIPAGWIMSRSEVTSPWLVLALWSAFLGALLLRGLEFSQVRSETRSESWRAHRFRSTVGSLCFEEQGKDLLCPSCCIFSPLFRSR